MLNIKFKTCPKCGSRKQLNERNFYPRHDRPGQYDPWCKPCKSRAVTPKAHPPIVLTGDAVLVTLPLTRRRGAASNPA